MLILLKYLVKVQLLSESILLKGVGWWRGGRGVVEQWDEGFGEMGWRRCRLAGWQGLTHLGYSMARDGMELRHYGCRVEHGGPLHRPTVIVRHF